MASDKYHRDAVALVVLAHPQIKFSVSAAANNTGISRQRFHQRLGDCRRRGWVERTGAAGAAAWRLTPRGSSVVETYSAKIRAVEEARGAINLAEVMAGQWAG